MMKILSAFVWHSTLVSLVSVAPSAVCFLLCVDGGSVRLASSQRASCRRVLRYVSITSNELLACLNGYLLHALAAVIFLYTLRQGHNRYPISISEVKMLRTKCSFTVTHDTTRNTLVSCESRTGLRCMCVLRALLV